MPSQLERFQETGDLHFLTFSFHARLPYLNDPHVCELFEHSLEAIRRRYVFFVFGYVIMPEHVHLLLSELKRFTVAHAIQALKTSVAKQCRERHSGFRDTTISMYTRAPNVPRSSDIFTEIL